MRLVRPIDFDILRALADHGRNVAANLALHLDRDRSYVNSRLLHLADYALVRKIGPHEQSGLYELTERGRAALTHRDAYDDSDVDFEAFLDAETADDE